MQVMVSPLNSAGLFHADPINHSAPTSIAKNLESQVTSSKTGANSSTNDPPANVKDTNKAHKPDSTSQSMPDRSDPTVKDGKAGVIEAVSTKPADTDHSQPVPVMSKAAGQDLPRSGATASTAGQPAPVTHEAEAGETSGPLPGTLVNSAKLIERMGHTEMRVGIHAGELGSVDIRTAISKHQFTAEISVEKGDLGRALTSELPGLHSRLSEQRIPFPSVTIQEYSNGSSSNLEQRQREDRRALQTNSGATGEVSQESSSTLLDAIAASEADAGSGIDLHM
jgi:flagellar hook-length control protein FliK